MQTETKISIADELALSSPKRFFDDSIGNRILQVYAESSWVETTEDIFRSWTGLRRINGEDYHGPIYGFGSIDDSVTYAGHRTCACKVCQQYVEPKFKMS